MEVHVCIENCEREFFVTQKDQIEKHNLEKNPRVEPDLESQILDELGNADFEQVSDELSIAKTENFIFRKYNDEIEDEIIWAEPVLQNLSNSVILD